MKFDLDILPGSYNYEADEIQLRQVITNILVNAVKFADQNKPSIFIKLAVNPQKEQGSDSIMITIEDNGKGFESLEAENVFEKYAT